MPELPDIEVYRESLRERIDGRVLERVRLKNPFLLRTAVPPIADAAGRRVTELRRLGKRIVIGLEGELFLVIHLMIAGRLHWRDAGAWQASRATRWRLSNSTTARSFLTEAGSKRRASLHLVAGEAALRALDPGGIDVMSIEAARRSRARCARATTRSSAR